MTSEESANVTNVMQESPSRSQSWNETVQMLGWSAEDVWVYFPEDIQGCMGNFTSIYRTYGGFLMTDGYCFCFFVEKHCRDEFLAMPSAKRRFQQFHKLAEGLYLEKARSTLKHYGSLVSLYGMTGIFGVAGK